MPVYNGRKRKVRSLSQRGGTFYARLKITYPGEEEAKVRRVPLKARTVPEATFFGSSTTILKLVVTLSQTE